MIYDTPLQDLFAEFILEPFYFDSSKSLLISSQFLNTANFCMTSRRMNELESVRDWNAKLEHHSWTVQIGGERNGSDSLWWVKLRWTTESSHWHGSFSRHSSLLWDQRIAVRIIWNSPLVRMEFSILWLRMIFLLCISLLLKRKIRQASLASSSSSSIEFAPLPVMTPDRRLRVPASKDTRYPVICHHRDQIQFFMQLEPLQLRLLPPKPWTPDLLPLRPLAPTTNCPPSQYSYLPRRCTTTTTNGSLCCRIWPRFRYDFARHRRFRAGIFAARPPSSALAARLLAQVPIWELTVRLAVLVFGFTLCGNGCLPSRG